MYARVSTEKQAEKELSIPAQLQAMREYAQRQGWTILEEYTEPGASGRSAERPVLRRLLARCKTEPKIDVVLVHKVDRLARNVYDHATIKALLKQHAIRLASVVENMDDSITGQLVENIMASIADFYSANLGEEVKKGMTAKIQRGEWPHQPPYGYRLVKGENGRTVAQADPVLGALMRQAFELYASGYYSLKHVARELAPKGLVTRLGKPFAASQMNLLLRNPFYTGRLAWKGQVYPGAHEGIVDAGMFERVQLLLTSHAHRSSTRYGSLEFWLKGLAHCGACGTKMTAERHKGHSYYRCLANARGRHLCDAPFSNADRIHGGLSRAYGAVALSAGAKERLWECAERTAARVDVVGSARQRQILAMTRTRLLQRQVKAAEAYTAGDMSRETYRLLAARIGLELSAVEQTLDALSADPHASLAIVRERIMVCNSLWDIHNVLMPVNRAAFAQVVFSKLVLAGSAVSRVELRPFMQRLISGCSRRAEDASDPGWDQELEGLVALLGPMTQSGAVTSTDASDVALAV
jgi:site-specific DNA recombinase